MTPCKSPRFAYFYLKYARLDTIPPDHPSDPDRISNLNSVASCRKMIHRRLHTLLDFGSELEVAEAISQSTSGEGLNSPDECGQVSKSIARCVFVGDIYLKQCFVTDAAL